MTKKKNKEIKTAMSQKDIDEKLHKMSHDVFDEACEKIHNDIGNRIEQFTEKYTENVTDENRFEYVISPLIIAHMDALVDYAYHLGYSRGELFEMVCDFYEQAKTFDDEGSVEDEEEGDEHLHVENKIDKKNMN